MYKTVKQKKGSAIAFCLTFATVLLTMGLAYSSLTANNKKQTIQIDERIKLDYLAQGMAELAVLKYQLYPTDFYACMEASENGDDSYLKKYTMAEEFRIIGDKSSKSSFNENGINLEVASFTILTDNKWTNEVLYVEAFANYFDQFGRDINKRVTRIVDLNRKSLKP